MKNAVFWDVAPRRSCVNRPFGGKYRLHLQGRKIRKRGTNVSRWLHMVTHTCDSIYVYLEMSDSVIPRNFIVRHLRRKRVLYFPESSSEIMQNHTAIIDDPVIPVNR
jgi:hypothetical protein